MYYQRTGSKYNNARKVYNGRSYHSKREAAYAQELDLMKKAGEIQDYSEQVRLPLDVNGYHICNYIVDFMVINKDGEKELHEVKGFETDTWRLKWKLTEAIYGKQYKLIVIK